MSHGLWPAIVLFGVFFFLFGPFRHRARYRRGQPIGSGEGGSPERLMRLEGRLTEMDSLEGRVAELENRLDFAERLLAGRREGADR